MGKLMYMDKTYSSTVENCTGLKYDNASSGLDAENVQDAIDETNSNLSQLSNPNIFINGNFQIWSNGESFEVFGTNNEGTTTVICDKWYAKHYDLENNYYITKAGAQGIRLFSASEVPCYIYQILDEETFNALQGKTVTLSWSYTQSYGDANHVEYETIEESEQILVGTDLDVFTAMTKIGFTNGIAGCIVHWIKLEVGELKTPCVPDSKDAIICKLERNLTYSKEEICTGETWIDGKPIYRKTFVFADTLSSPTTEIPPNIENVDKIWVDTSNSYFHQGSSYYPVTYAQYPSGLDAVTTLASTKNIVFNIQTSCGTAWQKVITLRYTKTTD